MQPLSSNKMKQLIYIMQIAETPELLKIGRSRDPWKRRRDLEKYYRNKLILVYKSNPHFLADKIELNVLHRLKRFQVPGLGEREIFRVEVVTAINVIQEEFIRLRDKPLEVQTVYVKPPKMLPSTGKILLPPDAWPNAVGVKRRDLRRKRFRDG